MATLFPSTRAFIAVSGADAVHFLQGLLTQDVTKLAAEKIQFAALLSPQGKILHDMFLLNGAYVGAGDGTILLDTPALYKDTLLKRLALYKLRAAVTIREVSDQWSVRFVPNSGWADPRHPALPQRIYSHAAASVAEDDTSYRQACLALGIPDSAHDFAPDEVIAPDAGYDLLHAISYTKGCYVGQEITARMHYKNIARRGFYVLSHEEQPVRLALLKFDAVEKSAGVVVCDGTAYQATLPLWMKPKLQQFQAAKAIAETIV